MFENYLNNLNNAGASLPMRLAALEAASHLVYRYNEMFRLLILRELYQMYQTLTAYNNILNATPPGRIPIDTTIEGVTLMMQQVLVLRAIYGNWTTVAMADGAGPAGYARLEDPTYPVIAMPVPANGPNSAPNVRSITYMGSTMPGRPAYDRGESLTTFLLAFYHKGVVTGYSNLIYRKTGFATRRFNIGRKANSTFYHNQGLQRPVVNDILLAAGLVLVIGTHRAGKTTTVSMLNINEVGLPVPARYNRLPINEPDAISGSIPEAAASMMSVINRIHTTNDVLVLDSLTSLGDVVAGNLKTGGVNWGIFLYLDELVQFSFHRNFIVVMSIEEKEFDQVMRKLRGRIPNIIHVTAPGMAEVYVRGSSPNEPVTPDRHYSIVMAANVVQTPFNIV